MSNLFTKIYNMLYYTTNLYLQYVLEMPSIHFNALIDTYQLHHQLQYKLSERFLLLFLHEFKESFRNI